MSCLHWAVSVQSFELVRLIIENRNGTIDKTLVTKEGKTALELALKSCDDENNNNIEMIAAFLMSFTC